MVNLSLLSQNIGTIFDEILKNQRLLKYIYYTDKDPQAQPDLTDEQKKGLIMNKILPTPFNPYIYEDETVELRFYFPSGKILNDSIYAETKIFFEIVVGNTYWLAYEGDKDIVRPYEILNELVQIFADKSIGTLGKIKFENWYHFVPDDKFGLLRLEAQLVTW